jgi:hypothetical protein
VAEPARDEAPDELAALPIDPDLGPGEAIFPTQQSGVSAPGVALFAAGDVRRQHRRRLRPRPAVGAGDRGLAADHLAAEGGPVAGAGLARTGGHCGGDGR